MKVDKTRKVSSVNKEENIRKDSRENFRNSSNLNNKGYQHEHYEEFDDLFDLANKKYETNEKLSKSRKDKVDLEEIKKLMEGRNIGQIYKLTRQLENNSLEQGIKQLKAKKGKEVERRRKNIVVDGHIIDEER